MTPDIRHLAYCDIHAEAAVRFDAILAWQKNFDPHRIVLNGDVFLGEYASHWNEKKAFKYLGFTKIAAEIEREIAITRALLRRIRETSPRARIDWVLGNHEAFYLWVAMFYPQCGIILGAAPNTPRFRNDLKAAEESLLPGIIRRHFKTDELEIAVYPYYKRPLTIGPLNYFHGHQFKGVASPQRLYPNMNTVIGHFHQKRFVALPDSGRRGRPIEHWAVPTLMRLGRGYEQSESSNHSNGFFYASSSPSGAFEAFVKPVYGDDGRLFAWKK